MELLAAWLNAAGYAAVPALAAAWLAERWRSRRRNANGTCAACAHSWSELDSSKRLLIHGRLVCEGCAARARKRLGWQFGFLSGAALLASAGILLIEGPTLFVLMPPTAVAAMAVGAAGLMKLANRRAQGEIATGSYPFLLSPGGEAAAIQDGE